jgi:23S rRNA (cytosine1962-C5)-methyltransferase
MSPLSGPVVYLNPRRAKPFFLRHPWVFSGAAARVEGSPEKGAVVTVADARGMFIGRGLYNADSQILVRLLTWDADEAVDDAFWRRRLEAALRLRRDVLRLPALRSSAASAGGEEPEIGDAYRLVFSESDGLPGLIVDRYADFLVAQFLAAGMAAHQEKLLDLLMEIAAPKGIYDRSDDESAEKEGIPAARGLRRGEAPQGPVEISVRRTKFMVDIAGGQKTGFFLDQSENRAAAAAYLKGRSVLDAFSYTGAFGITAAVLGGCGPVLALDRSAPALEMARRNFELNGITQFETRPAQIADEFRELKKSGRKFGAVILDPPKFARSRPGVERALRAYRDLNLLAMQLLEEDGILVTCSCSGHVSSDDFLQMINESAVEAGVTVQILERRGQAADHPVISSCAETAYLKCFICRVSRGGR